MSIYPATEKLVKWLSSVNPSSPLLKTMAQYTNSSIVPQLALLEKDLGGIKQLDKIYKDTGVPPLATAAAAGSVLVIILLRLLKKSGKAVTDAAGVLIPVLQSLRAIERPRLDDDERWLTYCKELCTQRVFSILLHIYLPSSSSSILGSLFGLLTCLDNMPSLRNLIPFYFTSKMIFFHWLAHRDGSLWVYRYIARPLLIKYDGLLPDRFSTPTAVRSAESSPSKHQRSSSSNLPQPFAV